MIERRIKELSIALEALSRINGFDFEQLSDKIRGLLDKAIEEAQEQTQKPTIRPSTQAPEDEIPF